jgi:hypothetical protein
VLLRGEVGPADCGGVVIVEETGESHLVAVGAAAVGQEPARQAAIGGEKTDRLMNELVLVTTSAKLKHHDII